LSYVQRQHVQKNTLQGVTNQPTEPSFQDLQLPWYGRQAGPDTQIRAGVHTGEIELRGDKVAAVAAHLAIEVTALEYTSEVLAIRTVRDWVCGSEVEFGDHGNHGSKGFSKPWHILSID